VISPEILHTQITVQYGLSERCELEVVDVPGQPGDGRLEYTNYTCRKFPTPVSDSCEKENRVFCTSWTSAGYATELAIGFAALSLVTIVIGVSTHSRRRRIWRAVAGLVILHSNCLAHAHKYIMHADGDTCSFAPDYGIRNRYRNVSHVQLSFV